MKKIKSLASLLVAGSVLFSSMGNAFACTAILVSDINGNFYKGRTLEFSSLIPTSLTYMPKGTKIESASPSGQTGITFSIKYPILGMAMPAGPNVKQVSFLEGVNDQGLTFSANYFNEASTLPAGSETSKALSSLDFGSWIVGSFRTVAEVKSALQNNDAEIWQPLLPSVGNVPLPLHYAINDKSGAAIIIEFQHGKVNVFDNPVGVMTNGPEFPWHLTNLNNYTQSNIDKNTGQLGSLKLKTEDSGIALAPLPSAETATGRFVKAAFYVNYVRKGKTPDDEISTLGHLMNNFDRPSGLTVDLDTVSDGSRSKSISSEISTWTVMNDLSRNLFYVRSVNALNWAVVDIEKLKDVTKVKTISTYDVDRAGADAFNLFYK